MADFDPQNFLMSNVEIFAKFASDANDGYNNFVPLTGEYPAIITNDFSSIPNINSLYTLMSEDPKSSNLVESVEFFKVYDNKFAEAGVPSEFKYDLDCLNITKKELREALKKGDYEGLKNTQILSFSYSLNGVDPAQAKSFVTANLKLLVTNPINITNDIALLDHNGERTDDPLAEGRISELISFSTTGTDRQYKRITNFVNEKLGGNLDSYLLDQNGLPITDLEKPFKDYIIEKEKEDSKLKPEEITKEKEESFKKIADQYWALFERIDNSTEPFLNPYRIKARVSLRDDSTRGNQNENKKLQKQFNENSYVDLFLTPYKHSINIIEYGAVELDIQFGSYFESVLGQPDFINDPREHSSILQGIMENNKVFTVTIQETDNDGAKTYSFGLDTPGAITGTNLITDLKKDVSGSEDLRKVLDGLPDDNYELKYFYLGDLIDILLAKSKDIGQRISKTRFVLGDVVIERRDGTSLAINMAYLPISLDSYKKWYEDNIKEEEKVSLLKIFRDLFQYLVKDALIKAKLVKGQIPALSFANYDFSSNDSNEDPIFKMSKEQGSKRVFFKNIAGNIDKAKSSRGIYNFNYFYFYSAPSIFNPKKNEDSPFLIVKPGFSRDGIQNSVSFDKIDVPFQTEKNIEQQGYTKLSGENGAPAIIPTFYNASVTLRPAPIGIRPGMIIKIDPNADGTRFQFGDPAKPNSVASILGIGGYYLATEINYEFSKSEIYSGRLTCNFKANFLNKGQASPQDQIDEFLSGVGP